MPNSNQNTPARINNRAIAFVDYVPAELRKGVKDNWIIVYYAKNPFTEDMERFRLRAPKFENTRTREQHAKRIITEINRKLSEERWSPFEEKAGNGFKTFSEATDSYLKLLQKELKDGIKREDTIRSYTSMVNLLHLYIKEKEALIKFAGQFSPEFVTGYLDWVYYDRNNSPRTYNNHLLFLKTLSTYFIGRGFIKADPTLNIKRKPKTQKIRVVFDDRVKEIIREYLPVFSWEFFVLCMLPYYSMVRRTEITKLRRIHFDLQNDVINIPGWASKNGKDESVTIPFELKPLLEEHFAGCNKGDWAFSADGFRPGVTQLKPKKISDEFGKFRKLHNLPNNLQWYSFKDTGITDMFGLGSMSPLQIRDQARHKDLKTTELYTARTKAGDIFVKNSGIKF